MAGGVGSQSQLRCGHEQLAGLEVLTEENHGICCRNNCQISWECGRRQGGGWEGGLALHIQVSHVREEALTRLSQEERQRHGNLQQ